MPRGPKGAVVTRSVTTTKKITMKLTAADVRKRFRLPDDAVVSVGARGADGSTTVLNLDAHPIEVSWTETKEG